MPAEGRHPDLVGGDGLDHWALRLIELLHVDDLVGRADLHRRDEPLLVDEPHRLVRRLGHLLELHDHLGIPGREGPDVGSRGGGAGRAEVHLAFEGLVLEAPLTELHDGAGSLPLGVVRSTTTAAWDQAEQPAQEEGLHQKTEVPYHEFSLSMWTQFLYHLITKMPGTMFDS